MANITGKEDVIINVRARINEAVYDLRRMQKEVGKATSRISFETLAVQQEQVRKSTEALDKAMGKIPFAGYAMSIMFFGMALQQMSLQIMRFGTKAFTEVMHSVEGTVTQSDYLSSSMRYLGFSIGEALEPVLAWLVPIVDAVADWVAENPKLTAGLLAAAAALGTILSVGGALKLAFDGFAGLFGVLGLQSTTLSAALSSMGTAFLPIAAAIAAVILLWTTNFAGFQELVGSLWTSVKNAFSGILNGLKNIFGGLWDILKGLFTGNFDLILQGFIKLGLGIAKVFSSIMDFIATLVMNAFAFAINIVTSAFFNLVKLVISAVRSIIAVANLVPGVNIGFGGLDEAQKTIDMMKEATRIDYVSSWRDTAEGQAVANNIINQNTINFNDVSSDDVIETLKRYGVIN